jgi:hypothetical protein
MEASKTPPSRVSRNLSMIGITDVDDGLLNIDAISPIPPTAVGGRLSSDLHSSFSQNLIPPTAVGGYLKPDLRDGEGWTLTIHRLPSVGFGEMKIGLGVG